MLPGANYGACRDTLLAIHGNGAWRAGDVASRGRPARRPARHAVVVLAGRLRGHCCAEQRRLAA
eukprot:8633163-Lingulodinium_polyedra.AAC.1